MDNVPIQYRTLTEMTKFVPNRPSTNCMWRWCRRGVLARSGERVRLQHVRIGGQLFSTFEWLEEFGRKLAEADAHYFEVAEKAAEAASGSRPGRQTTRRAYRERRRREIEDAERRLREVGI